MKTGTLLSLAAFPVVLPISVAAKAPTTIVYAKPQGELGKLLLLSNGSLSEQKEWQDRLQKWLKDRPSIKAYTFIPSRGGPLSGEELNSVAEQLKAEGVTGLLLLESIPLQGGTECRTSMADRIYNMPEFGQQSRTVCSSIDDRIFRITITGAAAKKVIAASELRASEQGLFEGLSTELGSSRAKQMIDRMMKSLAGAGAL